MVDRITNVTVAAGMIIDRDSEDEADDLWSVESEQSEKRGSVTAEEREARFGQKAVSLLITGLTGSGKTSVAYALERRLFDMGRASAVLDGVNIRRGLTKELGFTAEQRSENLRRSSEVAKLMNGAGLIAICAFVAPSEDVRQKAAHSIGEEQFMVIHLDAPIDICRERDDQGMYAKADAGEIVNFPGVSSEYESPADPALKLNTAVLSVDECVDRIIGLLEERDILA